MAQNKTTATDASVEACIASRANAQQAADCRDLMALHAAATGREPRMWGPSIVGYGSYRYVYESGRSGEAPLAAFAIRGREIVLYLSVDGADQQARLAQVGKHTMTKSCLYFKRLEDLDRAVVEALVAGSIAETVARYGRSDVD